MSSRPAPPGLVGSFVQNPVKVTVAALLLALFGVIALLGLPMQLVPEVQIPTITIETPWPGASPAEVEREIVLEQEEQLKSVEGLQKLSSESLDSLGRVTLEFAVGADIAETLLKVNARLQQVPSYPQEADEPVITTSSSSDSPIAWLILRPRVVSKEEIRSYIEAHPEAGEPLAPVLKAHNTGLRLARLRLVAKDHPKIGADLLPAGIDVTKMRRFAEDVIESRLERVPGVSNSNVLGGRDDEVQVRLRPEDLAARQLTVVQVRDALRRRNVDVSGGDYYEGKRRYVVRTLGRLRSPEEVADVIVARRDGQPVYVRDIAEVVLDYKKADGLVRNFGTTSIAINCQRETGANVLDVMNGIREATAELVAGPLAEKGLYLEQVYDETDYIYSAIDLVRDNMLLGAALTVIVLLIFLRSARSTLVLAIAIPTSIIGTFLVLGLLGRSLNVVSLAGMAFAIGMLVDNAVVVLENIYRHHREGKRRRPAAVDGTTEVWGAVVASTLTTLAVFIPVLFVEEEAGQLFRDIAIAISAAVFLSMLVSAVLIPTATARILEKPEDLRRPRTRPAARILRVVGRTIGAPLNFLHWLGGHFVLHVVKVNRLLLGHWTRGLAAALVIVLAVLLGARALVPEVEYLPTGNRNLVFGIILPPPGYNLDQLVELGETIEGGMRPYWDIDLEEGEERDEPGIRRFFYVARGRQVFMGCQSVDPLAARELVPIIQRQAFSVPGTFGVAKQSSLFDRGLTAGRTVDIEITGPDLVRLVGIGGRMYGMLKGDPRLASAQVLPQPSLDLSNPEVHVIPRWDKAADLGLTAEELGYTVNAFVDGAFATDYYLGADKIDLVLSGGGNEYSSLQALKETPVVTPGGKLLTLEAIAEVSLSSGPEQINHRERERAITLQVTPPEEMPLEEAVNYLQEKIVAPLREQGVFGDDVRVRLAGTADKLEATWKALRFNLILALLITYLLMAALFESWVYPFIVIVSVPLGAFGGLGGLWLLNRFGGSQPLDVLTMLGFVILIGTTVNNAILIVHQSLNNLKRGLEKHEAITESVRSRIRPIFMTTLTTSTGLVPLVFAPGAGSELYRGLGAVILGGLLFSTFLTLVLIPTLFGLLVRYRRDEEALAPSPPPAAGV